MPFAFPKFLQTIASITYRLLVKIDVLRRYNG
jgi:hypothetical protein